MPYDPDQLLHDFDSNHGAVLDSSEPGFTINSDGSFTISQLVNTVGPIGGYGSFQDNNNGPFGTPSEQDLVAFRVTSDTVDSSFYTYPFQYYFDRENATLDGVNTSPPQGAILVGYAQVGSTQAFLLEQLASYVAGSVPVPGLGTIQAQPISC